MDYAEHLFTQSCLSHKNASLRCSSGSVSCTWWSSNACVPCCTTLEYLSLIFFFTMSSLHGEWTVLKSRPFCLSYLMICCTQCCRWLLFFFSPFFAEAKQHHHANNETSLLPSFLPSFFHKLSRGPGRKPASRPGNDHIFTGSDTVQKILAV